MSRPTFLAILEPSARGLSMLLGVQRAVTFEEQNTWYHNTDAGSRTLTTLDPNDRVTVDQCLSKTPQPRPWQHIHMTGGKGV